MSKVESRDSSFHLVRYQHYMGISYYPLKEWEWTLTKHQWLKYYHLHKVYGGVKKTDNTVHLLQATALCVPSDSCYVTMVFSVTVSRVMYYWGCAMNVAKLEVILKFKSYNILYRTDPQTHNMYTTSSIVKFKNIILRVWGVNLE